MERKVTQVSLDEIRAARNNGSIFPTPRTITRNSTPSKATNKSSVAVKPVKPIAQPKPATKTTPAVVKPVPVATQPVKIPTAPTKTEIENAFEDSLPISHEGETMGAEYIALLKEQAKKNKAPTNLLHGEYVNKLKPEEIKNIFMPFGYIDHEQMDSQIYVICKYFDIMFSDFTFALFKSVDIDTRKWLTDSKFYLEDFEDYLDQIGLTLEQGIDEHVAIWLSERFPSSYPAARKTFKENNNKNAFKGFAASRASERLTDIARELKTKQDKVNDITFDRGYTGFYNPTNKK